MTSSLRPSRLINYSSKLDLLLLEIRASVNSTIPMCAFCRLDYLDKKEYLSKICAAERINPEEVLLIGNKKAALKELVNDWQYRALLIKGNVGFKFMKLSVISRRSLGDKVRFQKGNENITFLK